MVFGRAEEAVASSFRSSTSKIFDVVTVELFSFLSLPQ
jgi:hypothetical protein